MNLNEEELPMKRIRSLLLALVFVLALAPAVSADVIVSPIDLIADVLDLKTVLLAVCAVAALSGAFLWITRKKK